MVVKFAVQMSMLYTCTSMTRDCHPNFTSEILGSQNYISNNSLSIFQIKPFFSKLFYFSL